MNFVESSTHISLGIFTLISPGIADVASQNHRIVVDQQTLSSQTELVQIGDSRYRITAQGQQTMETALSQINKTIKQLNPFETQYILTPEFAPVSDEKVHFAPGENPSYPLITNSGIVTYSNLEFGDQYEKSTLYGVDPKIGDTPFPISTDGFTNIAYKAVGDLLLVGQGSMPAPTELKVYDLTKRAFIGTISKGDWQAIKTQADTDGITVVWREGQTDEIRGFRVDKGEFVIDPNRGFWQGKSHPGVSGNIAVWQEVIQGRNGMVVRTNIDDPYNVVERFVLPDTNLHMTDPSLSGNKLVVKVSDLKGPNSQVRILLADIKKRDTESIPSAEFISTDPNLFVTDVKIAGDWIVWAANDRKAEHAKSYVFALNHRTGQRFKVQHDDAYQPYILPDPKDSDSAFIAYSRGTAYFGEKRELWVAKVKSQTTNNLPEAIKNLVFSDVDNREGLDGKKAEIVNYELLRFTDSGLDEKCKLPDFMYLQIITNGGRIVVRIPGKTTYEYFFSNPEFGEPNIEICDATGTVIPSLTETSEKIRKQQANLTGIDPSRISIKIIGVTKNSSLNCNKEFAGALFVAYDSILRRGDLYFSPEENGKFNPDNIFYCQRIFNQNSPLAID